MLTLERFRNSELNALQTKQNYTDVMRYFTELIGFLIKQGELTDKDAEIIGSFQNFITEIVLIPVSDIT